MAEGAGLPSNLLHLSYGFVYTVGKLQTCICRPPVKLKHVLRQIDADDANFFHGCPLL